VEKLEKGRTVRHCKQWGVQTHIRSDTKTSFISVVWRGKWEFWVPINQNSASNADWGVEDQYCRNSRRWTFLLLCPSIIVTFLSNFFLL